MKKKKKKFDDPLFNQFKNKIINHNNDIWTPPLNINYQSINTNSWFNCKKFESNYSNINTNILEQDQNKPKKIYKCIKVQLKLDDKQQQIMKTWLNAFIHMYNQTLLHIKTNVNLNSKNLNHLKDLRKYLNKFNFKIFDNIKQNINTKIYKHKDNLDFKNIRTNYIKKIRDELIKKS
jgi:hypothetical protein